MTIATAEQLKPYLDAFSEFEKSAQGQPAWLRKIREDAFERFCQAGLPTTRDEDWRFTNLSAVAQTTFRLARSREKITREQIERFRLPGAACQLVFVNGAFSRGLSELPGKQAGALLRVNGLAEELQANPEELEPHLGRYLNITRDAFCALNTALFGDGAYIRAGRGAALAAPVHALFITVPGDASEMAHPRNLVVAEAGSEITVIEDYVTAGGAENCAPTLCNTATELIAGENAVVSHYMIEREDARSYNISTLRIEQARDANVCSHSILTGGALVRNNVHPVLRGQGGECLINGLFLGGLLPEAGAQHLDNYMLVEHAAAHCGSRQFYNGILDRRAHGVFHGRIIVHKDAQKTDAKQTNRNLLLCDDAQVDTKPQLEIYADDVKCTHGATIGQIEENALFYLRSRGIDEAAARRLLLLAFATECLARMREGPARDYAERLIQEHLLRAEQAGAAAKAAAAEGSGASA